ncbi:MAG: hypothetical protein Q4F84_01465 [Fibrobacter sp.]|nr:hypothetical protein [Fibrobacter sp.]
MPTIFFTEKSCYVCQAKSRYPLINPSFSIVGPRDLDGRPSQIERASVYLWVQRCLECGYCAPEIAQGNPSDCELITTDLYKKQLNCDQFPETTNSFLCHSMLMENDGKLSDAGWAAVFGAWICDDNGFRDGAVICRKKAVSLFTKAIKNGETFAENPDQQKIYIIDLLRRASDFDKALKLCDTELEKKDDNRELIDYFDFERELVLKNDCSCHSDSTIEEMDY